MIKAGVWSFKMYELIE